MIARVLLGVVLALGLGAAARDATDRWIAATTLPVVLSETGTEVRDRDGILLRPYPVEDGIWRLDVSAAQVDPAFVAALVRYEDKRFWQHSGVDALALARAATQAAWNGRTVSGGSTLTMQVARLLENSGTGAWPGKLRQIRVALALERRLDKAQILRLYLLHAPYGGNLEGVRAATLAWFGKEPRRLTPAEIALLIALPQSPETRRPDRHPAAARAARDRVLDRMASAGLLPAQARTIAARSPLPGAMRAFARNAPHLSDRMRAQASETPVHRLTVDARVQAALETLAHDAVRGEAGRLSVAILAADHATGEVLASVGSPAYSAAEGRQGYVDMTQALRSPGSTLKPLVYALGFDQGLVHPETLINDGPVQLGRYAPQNFDGRYRGDVRVRDALQMSLNIPVIRLTAELGPARLMDAIRRAGARPVLSGGAPGLAVALGGVGMTLADLVQIYAALARGGETVALHTRTGGTTGEGARLVSDVAAWQVGHILSGLAPPPGAPRGVLAYKTGTSYGHRDAWAIGWDGSHVIGVWLGRADGTPVPGAFGGDLAAPVLFEAFGRLKPGFDPLPAPPAATLLSGAAGLPAPLRRFGPRAEAFQADPDAPQITFPPDGATLESGDEDLAVKLRGGAPPFSILANGQPVGTGLQSREIRIRRPGPGYSSLLLLDAQGRADRIGIRID